MGEPTNCRSCGLPLPPDATICPRDATPVAGAAAPARTDPLVGSLVGGYRVEALIGGGGMGVVYRGLQPDIGKPVAIKVLRDELAADAGHAQNLLAEARAVNAIGHRAIVDIFAFGALPDGRQYLVMELLSGKPLDRYLRERERLPVSEAVSFLDQLLDALGAAHRVGIVHRDLKPSNLFVVQPPYGEPYLKLLDFGLAKSLSMSRSASSANASIIVGTPAYLSPEQASGARIGPQADLYAAGVLLYEMLAGRLPYEGKTAMEMVSQHLHASVPRISDRLGDLPPEVDALVTRMLQKDPAQRYRSAEEVRAALRTLPLMPVTLGNHLGTEAEKTARSGPLRSLRRRITSQAAHVRLALHKRRRLLRRAALFALIALPAGAGGALGARYLLVEESSQAAAPGPAPVQRARQPAPPAPPPEIPEPTPIVAPTPAAPAAAAASAPAPAPPRPAKGEVKLHVFPWADIYVDGELRERGAMDLALELPAGSHSLRLVNPGFEDYTESLPVRAGKPTERRIRLTRSHAP